MSLALRPPWLETPEVVEQLLRDHNPQIPLSSLCASRNDCPIVAHLLNTFTSKCDHSPSEWEREMAKYQLAIDVQTVLARWIDEGRQATLKDSPLAGVVDQAKPQRRTLDIRGSMSLPLKRGSPDSGNEDDDDEEPDSKQARMAAGGEKDFRCPYYIRNKHDPLHRECKGKLFPNPRKLKEHIWRFTKPFKCPTCGEGFGREKTKAIHCDQRKVKCTPSSTNYVYANSIDEKRDREVERARNTTEILKIFEEYDLQKSQSSNHNMDFSSVSVPQTPSQTGPHEWSPSDEPHSPWGTTPIQQHLQLTPYPTTPAQTPPHSQTHFHPLQQQQLHPQAQSQQIPHSPTAPQYPHHTYPSRSSFSRPEVPQIIINDVVHSQEEIDEVLSAHSFHSQPGTPMSTSFDPSMFDEQIAQQQMQQQMIQHAHQQTQQQEQERRAAENAVATVYSNGYGSIPPLMFRIKDSRAAA